MEPLLILFDIDGTLVSAASAGRRSLEVAFRRVFGVDEIATLSARIPFEGRTDPRIVADMARAAGLHVDAVARRAPELREVYLEALRAEMARPDPRRRVLPGVVALLDDLRSRRGVSLGLLTGNIEAGARAKLEPFGLNDYFESGGFSSDHEDRGEIARIARDKVSRAARVTFAPERVTVVGDTGEDIACARAQGFRVVAVASGGTSRERLAEGSPDAHFADLTDLAAVRAALRVPAV